MKQETLPCSGCKGLCCGPVPVTDLELKKIKKKVRSMPSKRRQELASQLRFAGTCIFYDLDKDQCGIYSARPEICQKFGYHKDLVCFRNPEAATKPISNLHLREYVGTLSIDITWKTLEKTV